MSRNPKLEEAVARHRRGDLIGAGRLYEAILRQNPEHVDALRLLGLTAVQSRNPERAIRLFRKALKLDPGSAVTHSDLGAALAATARLDEALAHYDLALAVNPASAETLYRRGNCLLALKRFEEAIASYDCALSLHPRDIETHQNRGMALSKLGRLDEALTSFANAVRIDPRHPIAHYNVATALKALNRLEDALAGYARAIALKPDYADAHFARANVLRDLHRVDDALAGYDTTIALAPDHTAAHVNRGALLWDMKRLDDALASHETARRLNPSDPEIYVNTAQILADAKRYDAALETVATALRLAPEDGAIKVALSNLKIAMCDWSDIDQRIVFQEERIKTGQENSSPGLLISISDSPALLHTAATTFVERKYPNSTAACTSKHRNSLEKIRIGYFSSDFHNHATASLMAELFELQDHHRFDYVAVSFGPAAEDEMRRRLQPCFQQFLDVGNKSDREIADIARRLGIDIAVDLKGHTGDNRLGCFAHRMAPIQVNYLGHPGTIGADYIDYIIADRILIPEPDRVHYTEKVVYLPNSYQPNDRTRKIAETAATRDTVGLPPDAFVFCCFNNNYKIMPPVFDTWVRILKAIPESVLWLLEDSPAAARNLRSEALRRGLDPSRLIFAPRLPIADHLARQRLADLFLDTLPCNAHTTASDALWAGLPVLTCLGKTFAGRVAASLLNAIGLPELIASSLEDYENLAVALARDPDRLRQIKGKLAAQRLTAPLFDTLLYVRHLEAAYTAMVDRLRAKLPPDHIFVDAGNT